MALDGIFLHFIRQEIEQVARDARIGVVGKNGCGKSTLLKIILGQVQPDAGTVELGDTIKIGYFSQDNSHMQESVKAIEYVRKEAEYIDTGNGKISASMLMERFLFLRRLS